MTGNELHQQIIARGLTQKAFAPLAGWHEVSISRLVNRGDAELKPKIAKLLELAFAEIDANPAGTSRLVGTGPAVLGTPDKQAPACAGKTEGGLR